MNDNKLADALHNLSKAARELASALTELGAALDKSLAKPYREAGYPFGEDSLGLEMWLKYGQATTVN